MTTTPEERMANLETAIKRGGGLVKFASTMGISIQAIAGWRRRKFVPFNRAATVEKLFGVSRESLISPEDAEAFLMPREEGNDLL